MDARRSAAGAPAARLPGIEGLRAIAAGTILVIHCWRFDGQVGVGSTEPAATVLENLSLGVVLFFALSGFLLYRPFAAAIARAEELPRVGRYLHNRALRILPAYWVILLVTSLVLVSANLRDGDGHLLIGALDDPLELLASALLVQQYDPDTLLVGIGPAWSLAVEAVFYLLLPILVIAAARAARGRRVRAERVRILLAPALALLALGLAGKLVAGGVLGGAPDEGWQSDWYSVLVRSFLAQADLFAFGMAAAVAHTEAVDGRLTLPRHWRAIALVLSLTLLAAAAVTLGQGQLGWLPQNTVVALAAALLVAAISFPGPADGALWLRRVLETRALVAVGIVSYSVFLWHEPVIRWLAEHGVMRAGAIGFVWNLVVTIVAVGILSMLSYRFVERPALRRKHRPAATDTPMAAAQLEAAP